MFQNLNYKLQRILSDVLLCSFNKAIKNDSKRFSNYRRVTRRHCQVMRHFTSNVVLRKIRWDHVGCKDNITSWHLIGFPNGSNLGSTA